jgi:hypothetical protein
MACHFQANIQTLEAKNQMFEAKLENQALKAKLRDKSMERVGKILL